MGQEGEGNSLPQAPPEWVCLADAPGLIERECGVPAADVAVDLVLAVRSGELRRAHRIAGARTALSGHTMVLPPGLDWKRTLYGDRDGNRVMAEDWEAAEADWETGTVGGWGPRRARGQRGARERLTIEVSWTALAAFAASRARTPSPGAAPAADVAPPSATAPLPAAVDWLVAYAAAHIDQHGVPCKRDDALTDCKNGTGCTYREALAAWNELPAKLKRARRHTDRALTRR